MFQYYITIDLIKTVFIEIPSLVSVLYKTDTWIALHFKLYVD